MAGARICVSQHVACEDLGTFEDILAGRGFRADYVRLFAGDTVPADWNAACALILLGGPMSVNDESRYDYLAAEKAMIREALRRNTPILGVCLGAQLLANAAGARVFPGARPEIGWEPIALTEAGHQDPLLSGLVQLDAVFHWHGETFDLPPGAVGLARSAVTANQAMRIGQRAYGLQFHVEVDEEMIESWMRAYPNDLAPDAAAAARRITADTARYATALQAAAAATMNRFLDIVADALRTRR